MPSSLNLQYFARQRRRFIEPSHSTSSLSMALTNLVLMPRINAVFARCLASSLFSFLDSLNLRTQLENHEIYPDEKTDASRLNSDVLIDVFCLILCFSCLTPCSDTGAQPPATISCARDFCNLSNSKCCHGRTANREPFGFCSKHSLSIDIRSSAYINWKS